MANRTNHRGVLKQVRTIRRQFWYVLAASSVPFLFLAIVSILKADNQAEKLLFAATFIFGFGLALIASKVASHTAIERHLINIMRIDKAKSEFISTAAHQLKTPVSAFAYSLDAFRTAFEKDDREAMQMFITDLGTSVTRMKLLTSNLLDVTLIENEEIKLNLEEFLIIPMLKNTIKELQVLATPRGHKLDTRLLINETQQVYCDKHLLFNVCENLISNAFKYAAPNTTVELIVDRLGNHIHVSLTNETTVPITKDELEEIFLRFSEGAAGKNSESEGFGLGLSICKAYVESWGGSISAALLGPKKITFAFTVPIHAHVEEKS